jgi:hypothetical protein
VEAFFEVPVGLDAEEGTVHVRPDDVVYDAYKARVGLRSERQARYAALKGLPAQTLDGIAATALPLANKNAKQNLRQQAEALRAKALGYESDEASGEGKKELLDKAKAAEKIRDQAMAKGPYFDFAGLLLQLSIILISVVLITERRTLYLSGMTAAILGTFLSLDGFFLFLRIPLFG